MLKALFLSAVTSLPLLFSTPSLAAETAPRVFQYSLISSLLTGVYDSTAEFGWLKTKGDFGIGTFNGVDGEMLAVDGTFYQIKSDGVAYKVKEDQLAPYATVTFFKPDHTFTLTSAMGFNAFSNEVEKTLPSRNLIYAFRVDGMFRTIKTRSVTRQNKPYQPLADVVKDQSVFNLENVKGTMVGFWFPAYANGIAVPGFHFHFITEDKKRGGHVLDFSLSRAKLQRASLSGMELVLPSDKAFLDADLSMVDKKDLHKVEK